MLKSRSLADKPYFQKNIIPAAPLKAGYAARLASLASRQVLPLPRSYNLLYDCLEKASAVKRVHAHMPLWIALSTFTPSNDPRLGASSQSEELHRCALQRIFRPALENGESTRILRHPILM